MNADERAKWLAMPFEVARHLSPHELYEWTCVERERYAAEWLAEEQRQQAVHIASLPKDTQKNKWKDGG